MKGNWLKDVLRRFAVIAMMLVMVFTLLPATAQGTEAASGDIVLFSGSKHVEFTDWGGTDWPSAYELQPPYQTMPFDLNKNFEIKVDYSGADIVLIFARWEHGSKPQIWAQISPYYVVDGTAVFTKEQIAKAYGSDDFSDLDYIGVKPLPSADGVTVTKIVASYTSGSSDDVDINLKGIAGEWANGVKIGWNLGNTLDAYDTNRFTSSKGHNNPADIETCWGNPVTTKAMIDDIKAQGFNAVRVPVTWDFEIDDNDGYKVNEAWMARVKEVVDYVMDNDLYCILNVHHDTGEQGWLKASTANYNKNVKKFKALWKQIAAEFKNYDNKLAFEGFNEMLDEKNSWNYPGTDAGDAINLYNQAFVDVVRASGGKNGKRPLICNTYAGCTEAGALNSFKIPNDTVDNAIIAQVHFYQPTGYCFDMNPNQGQNMDVDYKTCGGESAADTLAMMLYKRFTEKGIPCIVGEFAASNKKNDDNRAAWVDYVVSKTGTYGVKCFWWDNGGTFTPNSSTGLDYYNSMAIYNRYTMKFEYPKVADALVNAANGGAKPTTAPTKKPTSTPKPTATPTKKPTSTPKPMTEEDLTELVTPTATPTKKPNPSEIEIFKGSKHVDFLEWGGTDWPSAYELQPPYQAMPFDLNENFEIKVDYTGADIVLIFARWEHGSKPQIWAQISPYYVVDGTAVFTKEQIAKAYGSDDFSDLDYIGVKPLPSAEGVTVTRIAVSYTSGSSDDVDINLKGIAGEWANGVNIGWNLGNTLDAYDTNRFTKTKGHNNPADIETCWGNPVTTKAMIDDIKAQGFNAVRVPVTWDYEIDDNDGYKVNEAWMARVKEVVDYVMDNDMYCIVNVHHDTGEQGWLKASYANYKKNEKKFKALWKQIAAEFKNYDHKLAFEGFNEMLDEKNSWNYPGADAGLAINLYNQAFVDVVRASGGKNSDRPLICNTYAGCTEAGALNSFEIPNDTVKNAIIAQVHFYQPTGYCFDMNPNQEQNMDVDYTTCGGESAADTLAMMLYKRFTEKGIPCIVGEFAASHKQNDDNRAAWVDYVVSKTGKYGVKCFWWDNGGTFTPNYSTGLDYYNSMGIYNRNTMKFEYPKVADALVKAANGGTMPTVAPTKKPTSTPKPTRKPTPPPKQPTRKPGKRVKYSALDFDGNVSSGSLIP